MNKGLTVAQLLNECMTLVNNGYGDKHIQISSDDEGNSFHSLFYGFTTSPEDLQYYVDEGMMSWGIKAIDDIIVLG